MSKTRPASTQRDTHNAFLPPSDEVPLDGMDCTLPRFPRMSAADLIRGMTMSTEGDVEKVRQADEARKQATKEADDKTWIELKPKQGERK